MKGKTILLVIALIAVIGGSALLYNLLRDQAALPGPLEPSEASDPEDGRIKAPDFTVTDMDKNEVRLSDMLGKPVVLNFWTSWCPYCKIEMPYFDKLYKELGGEVQFMMVNAVGSRGETRETGAEYIAGEGHSFPVFFDEEQEAVTGYGVRSFPSSVFIDAEGYAVAGLEGALDEETLRAGISLIMGE